jgi:hypothetical protein
LRNFEYHQIQQCGVLTQVFYFAAMLPLQSKRISEHLELDEIDKSIKSENKSTSVDGREGKENKRALHDIWAGRLADIVPTQGDQYSSVRHLVINVNGSIL